MRDRIRGVRQGGSDSFTGEMRIGVQHLSLCRAFAELPHDQPGTRTQEEVDAEIDEGREKGRARFRP